VCYELVKTPCRKKRGEAFSKLRFPWKRGTNVETPGEGFTSLHLVTCEKFPLSQRGRRRSDSGRVAARGLSCELGKASPQRIVSQMAPSSSLGLLASRDNPRALGAAPFSKGEFLATGGSAHFFTVFHAALRRHER
jgi:hypothetical protein